MQTGILEVVSYPMKDGFSKWREDLLIAKDLLSEAGMNFREIPVVPPPPVDPNATEDFDIPF